MNTPMISFSRSTGHRDKATTGGSMRKVTWPTMVLVLVWGSEVLPGLAQQGEPTNPFQGNAEAIEQGHQLFKLSCASCHGLNAKGSRGPDLTTGQWVHGGTDAQL